MRNGVYAFVTVCTLAYPYVRVRAGVDACLTVCTRAYRCVRAFVLVWTLAKLCVRVHVRPECMRAYRCVSVRCCRHDFYAWIPRITRFHRFVCVLIGVNDGMPLCTRAYPWVRVHLSVVIAASAGVFTRAYSNATGLYPYSMVRTSAHVFACVTVCTRVYCCIPVRTGVYPFVLCA